MNHVLGVDPGVHGACVVLDGDGQFVTCFNLPILGPPKRRVFDVLAFEYSVERLPEPRAAFVEELVSMPNRGSIGAQTSGVLYGAMMAVLVSNRVPVEVVRPRAWQAEIGGLPARPSTAGLSPKEKARVAAAHRTRLKSVLVEKARLACPDLAWVSFANAADREGLADAFWLARYGLSRAGKAERQEARSA